MVTPRAFISFHYDRDENSRALFVAQGKNSSPAPFTVADWSSREVLPQRTWEETIAIKIAKCNMLIALVGPQTSGATGMAKELAMAAAKDVPTFGVYIDGAGGATPLPTGLTRYRTIPWKWDLIARAVMRMMTEGKNAL
jgi:hypothetical protein